MFHWSDFWIFLRQPSKPLNLTFKGAIVLSKVSFLWMKEVVVNVRLDKKWQVSRTNLNSGDLLLKAKIFRVSREFSGKFAGIFSSTFLPPVNGSKNSILNWVFKLNFFLVCSSKRWFVRTYENMKLQSQLRSASKTNFICF